MAEPHGAAARPFPIDDHVGAWVPHGRWVRPPRGEGTLHGLRLAVQDLFDIAGRRCGAGLAERAASQPAASHDQALLHLLQASGAELAGQLVGDPFGHGLDGDPSPHGAPQNPRAPDRLSGGACGGAAAAVAAGLLHFALARDSGGSVAVAASHCGLWGLRSTQGLLPTEGILPLSPSFDSVGWLSAEGCVLERVAATLLPDITWRAWQTWRPQRLLCPADALALADPVFQAPMQAAADQLRELLQLPATARHDTPLGLPTLAATDWSAMMDTVIGWEAWQCHGPWIDAHPDALGTAARARFERARLTDAAAATQAADRVRQLRRHLRQQLGGDAIVLLPAACSLAPPRDTRPERLEALRHRTQGLAALAASAGLPQLTLPWPGSADAAPGLSLIGPAGSDRALIRLGRALLAQATRRG